MSLPSLQVIPMSIGIVSRKRDLKEKQIKLHINLYFYLFFTIKKRNMELRQQFIELLQRIGFTSEEIPFHWKKLEQLYSTRARHYHNLLHIQDMIESYSDYKSQLKNLDELLYAIFYHDIINKVTRKDNEIKSAEFAIQILPIEPNLNKELVYDMICATQLHQQNTIEDINWLIDFDLKILATDWKNYKTYYQQIRIEYRIYPNILYNPGRKKVLEHFLKNDFIYQTEIFRNKYETKARENIQREIKTL